MAPTMVVFGSKSAPPLTRPIAKLSSTDSSCSRQPSASGAARSSSLKKSRSSNPACPVKIHPHYILCRPDTSCGVGDAPSLSVRPLDGTLRARRSGVGQGRYRPAGSEAVASDQSRPSGRLPARIGRHVGDDRLGLRLRGQAAGAVVAVYDQAIEHFLVGGGQTGSCAKTEAYAFSELVGPVFVDGALWRARRPNCAASWPGTNARRRRSRR